ncbi:MAG TPA: tripartite tricarboxylate transporter substrate binding protein [Burkholderiales bacterium]|nr:tripartite tricarboxylate transporter substrate binding protein [Burkholderiales bacterium]
MNKGIFSLVRWFAGAVLLGMVCGAFAQSSYPTKTVKIIVPFGTGGPADIFARLVASHISKPLGQSVIVEDKPGAGSQIGSEAVAKAAPDGYTLLLISNTHAINETLYKHLQYNILTDFVPISQLADMPLVLVVNPSIHVKTVKELIALAKSEPGKLNYASSGSGTPYHLAMELFKAMTGINVVHVPYKASGEMRTAILAGQVQMEFDALLTADAQIKSGKLIGLGVSSLKRSPVAPNLPTIDEAGVPGYESDLWLGLVAPKGTPQPIIDKLNAAVVKVLADPDVKQRYAKRGAEPKGSSPQEFAKFLKQQVEKWGKVVKFSGAKVG